MKKFICILMGVILILSAAMFFGCEEDKKTGQEQEQEQEQEQGTDKAVTVTKQEWEKAFSLSSFSNVTVKIVITDSDIASEQGAKLDFTNSGRTMQMYTMAGGQIVGTSQKILVEKDGKTIAYSNASGSWVAEETQSSIDNYLYWLNTIISLKFEDAAFDGTAGGYRMTVQESEVTVIFDGQKRLSKIEAEGGSYEFTDYGRTEIEIPVIPDVTAEIFAAAVAADNYTMTSHIFYSQENQFGATLERSGDLYYIVIPFKVNGEEMQIAQYFKQENNGLRIYDTGSEQAGWVPLTEWSGIGKSSGWTYIKISATTIGQINDDRFPFYDMIEALEYGQFSVEGNTLTAGAALLGYLNSMSEVTGIVVSSLTVELRGNELYEICAVATYNGDAVTMTYSFEQVGTTSVNPQG